MANSNSCTRGRARALSSAGVLFITLMPLALLIAPAHAEPRFSAPMSLETGSNPHSVGIADLNADGRPDVLVANYGANTVSVLLGKGGGAFAARADFATGGAPGALVIADLNGDGRPDLAVANAVSNSVSVLLGNGDGTFRARTDFGAGSNPVSLRIADFNADGRPDVAVANLGSNTVSVLLGNGDGTFTIKSDFGVGSTPRSLATADFNGDGRQDLAVANQYGVPVSLLFGNGDGTFAAKRDLFFSTMNPSAIAIGDLNSDGRPDLAVAGGGYDAISVLLGNGDGTFAPAFEVGTGLTPCSVAIADFNADGRPDLATANGNSNSVLVLLQSTAGTFGSEPDLFTGEFPYSLAVADLNGDGRPDLAAANNLSNTVSLFLTPLPPIAMAFKLTPHSLYLAPRRHRVTEVQGPVASFAGSSDDWSEESFDRRDRHEDSRGDWVKGILEPATPFAARDIDIASIRLNDSVKVDPRARFGIKDHNDNGVPDLMVKFDRAALESILSEGGDVAVTVTGTVAGRSFIGVDHIRVHRARPSSPGGDDYRSADLAIRRATANLAAGGRLWVEFGLADGSAARLELLDVAGRMLTSREVGALGPGAHALDLGDGGALRPGIYFMRLSQGGSEVHARAVVIR